MAEPVKLSGNLKLFTALILLYFAFQMYFAILFALTFRFELYSQTTLYLSEFINPYLNYFAGTLLVISGFLLLGISRLKQNKHTRIMIGAVLLLILGIFRILMDAVNQYLQTHFFSGPIFSIIAAFTIVSLLLSAVTFLLVGTSILRRRTRPLIYGGVLLLLLFWLISILGLISMGSNFVVNGNVTSINVNTLYLYIVYFEIYAEWLPQLFFFIAFLFITQGLMESNAVAREKIPETKLEEQDKLVVFEK